MFVVVSGCMINVIVFIFVAVSGCIMDVIVLCLWLCVSSVHLWPSFSFEGEIMLVR